MPGSGAPAGGSLVPGVGPSVLRADGRRLPEGWWRRADLLVDEGSDLCGWLPDPCADMVDSPGSGVEAARAASGQAMRGVFPSWLLLLPAVGLWRRQKQLGSVPGFHVRARRPDLATPCGAPVAHDDVWAGSAPRPKHRQYSVA